MEFLLVRLMSDRSHGLAGYRAEEGAGVERRSLENKRVGRS